MNYTYTAIETDEQSALIEWSKLHPICAQYLFAIPNGGYRSKETARRLKKEGVKKGVSDLFLSYPTKGKHGLYIELKRKNPTCSRITPEQQEWIVKTRMVGYVAEVCYGWEHAVNVIQNYLGEK